ncbi:hypothetical protein CL644_01060 [bacterium]|mgnify:FL=1|nr:hypothetical protein [Parcubacteria group bacterium]MBF05279.1 hypothetical protein [bacterium]
MEMNEYQDKASETAIFEHDDVDELIYTALGLAGETGEVVEKIKKIYRNDKGVISEDKVNDLKREMGDVLWYLSQMARVLGVTLEDVAQENVKKLQDRQNRNVLATEGDDR